MHRDEVAERPDLFQGQLLNTKGGRDLWRNDGVVPYGLVRSERERQRGVSVTVNFSIGIIGDGGRLLSVYQVLLLILSKRRLSLTVTQ